jgi:hypothetical protein
VLSHVDLTPEEQAFRTRGVALTKRLGHTDRHLEQFGALGPGAFSIQGEDRSSYQPPGTGGGQFLIAKVSEWPTYIDPNFAANRAAAHQAGIPFGIYPFTHLTSSSPQQEFELMMNGRPGRAGVGSWQPNEWCMVDNEVSWNEGAMCTLADLIHESGCRYVSLYSYGGMFAAHDTRQAVTHFDAPHIAAYGSVCPGGDRWVPGGITPWWQFTDHDGLGMDRNAWTPSQNVADIFALINKPAPPPPPVLREDDDR